MIAQLVYFIFLQHIVDTCRPNVNVTCSNLDCFTYHELILSWLNKLHFRQTIFLNFYTSNNASNVTFLKEHCTLRGV
jgi:hypothetical protein